MRKKEKNYFISDESAHIEGQIFNINKDPALRMWACVIERAILDFVNYYVRHKLGKLSRKEQKSFYHLSRDLFRKNGGLMPICEVLSDYPEIMLQKLQDHMRSEARKAIESHQRRRRLVIRY